MAERKSLLNSVSGAVGAVALVLAMTGESKADVALGYAEMVISDFIVVDGGGTRYDLADFQAPVAITNTTTAEAELNGVSSSPPSSPTDVSLACVGNCAGIGQNVYAEIPNGNTFSRADARLTGAIITGTPAGNAAAVAEHVAETRLNTSGEGNAGAEISNNSTFEFVAGFSDTMTFEFDADILMRAQLDTEATPTGPTGGAIRFTIVLREVNDDGTTTTIFNWAPDGSAATGLGVFSETDPFALTDSISANLPGDDFTNSNSDFFSATTQTLVAGQRYQLEIQSEVSSDAAAEVPEPATLALMAGGLIFLAFLGLRSRRQSHTGSSL